MNSEETYKHVQERYGSIARAQKPERSDAIAQAFGYTEEELKSIPQGANLGVSCGNPLAIASLREGETVIDLGSGAGFDVFLAAKRVGIKGHAIGVDMNKDMLARARANQAKIAEPTHISFIEGKITSVPLEDGIADCIISNCVVNLVPETEKPLVFSEMARLLKPGGKVAISDILARKELPALLRENVALYVGCVAGCSMQQDYARFLKNNGFKDVVIVDSERDLNVYIDRAHAKIGEPQLEKCCSDANGALALSESSTMLTASCAASKSSDNENSTLDLADIDLNEWAGSFKIFAVKAQS